MINLMKSLKSHYHTLAQNAALFSLNRYFYVLAGDKVSFKKEHQGTVHFAVFQDQNLLILTDESQKLVNFYKLHDIVSKGEFTPICTQ